MMRGSFYTNSAKITLPSKKAPASPTADAVQFIAGQQLSCISQPNVFGIRVD
jgi:hypothetical protein